MKPDFEEAAESLAPYRWSNENDPTGAKRQWFVEDFVEGAQYGWDSLLKQIEDERNVLQNTGSLMWHNPNRQKQTLEMANHLDKALQYIKMLVSEMKAV